MKNTKPFLIILIFSAIFSMIGFIVDLDERYPDVMVNVKDILVMTVLLFVSFSVFYILFLFIAGQLSKRLH